VPTKFADAIVKALLEGCIAASVPLLVPPSVEVVHFASAVENRKIKFIAILKLGPFNPRINLMLAHLKRSAGNQMQTTLSTERGPIVLRAAFDFHNERQAKGGCRFDFLRK